LDQAIELDDKALERLDSKMEAARANLKKSRDAKLEQREKLEGDFNEADRAYKSAEREWHKLIGPVRSVGGRVWWSDGSQECVPIVVAEFSFDAEPEVREKS